MKVAAINRAAAERHFPYDSILNSSMGVRRRIFKVSCGDKQYAARTGRAASTPDRLAAAAPAGLAAFTPAGLAAFTPAGLAAFTPAGLAAFTPAGLAAFTPAGLAAFTPAGLAAFTPAGLAASAPAGRRLRCAPSAPPAPALPYFHFLQPVRPPQHLAGLAAIGRPDNAVALHHVQYPGRAAVAQPQVPLQSGCRCLAHLQHQADGLL